MKKLILKIDEDEIETVICIVCNQFQVSFDEIVSRTRIPKIVMARVALSYSLFRYGRLNNTQISQRIKRDHSTVTYYLVKAYDSLYLSEKGFRKSMNEVKKKISNYGI